MCESDTTRRKTDQLRHVFVIGAGASVPYGFPTGFELIQRLRQESIDFDLQQRILFPVFHPTWKNPESYFDSEQMWQRDDGGKFVAKWKELIQGSVILTIDQFLKNQGRIDPKREAFGKALMAEKILSSEARSLHYTGKDEGSMHSIDWIQYLLTQVDLQENWEDYLRQTTFITFNYDRVLEFFVRQYLVIEHSRSLNEADEFLAKMSIHHMNGSLGSLRELPFGNASGGLTKSRVSAWFPSGQTDAPAEPDFRKIADRLRTVWDSEDQSENTEIHQKIANAERIFILGTSFIPENLRSVGLGPLPRNGISLSPRVNIRATGYKISDAQVQRAAKAMGILTGEDWRNIKAEDYIRNVSCKDMVIDEVVL